jgi:hypothetical protein
MYLDRSLGCVEAFLGFVLFPRIDLAIKEKLWIDSKTKLAKTIFNVTKTRNFIPYYKWVLKSERSQRRDCHFELKLVLFFWVR